MIRKHRRPQEDSDLDITAFMNLMIVLVPILLMNLIFAQTSIIELNFPKSDSVSQLDPESFDLSVAIYPESIDVLEGEQTLIRRITKSEKGYDFVELGLVMQELKRRVPDKRDITLLAKPDTPYQALISTMDAVRSYTALVAGNAVEAELFPDIGISDAPLSRLPSNGGA